MKLAFIREPGFGDPIKASAYPTPGWALELHVSAPETVLATTGSVTKWTPNGVFAPNPIPARPAYLAQFFATSPDAWQSGWATNWDHAAYRAEGIASLYGPYNLAAQGKAELGPAMVYQMGPSLGQVAPKMI